MALTLGAQAARAGVADLSLYGDFGFGGPIPGTSVSELLDDPSFPDDPRLTSMRGDLPPLSDRLEFPQPFEEGDAAGDNYGSMTEGYLEVPVSGEYRFFVSSDDGSRLELSTDHEPDNARVVAEVPGDECCLPFVDDGIRSSEPISLETGNQYYFRFLHKEGEGSDWFRVGWTGPTFEAPTVIPMRFVQRFVDASNPPVVTASPEDQAVIEQRRVVLTADVNAKAPVDYQWFRNGEPIDGAQNSSLELTPSLEDDGARFEVELSNDFGSVTSETATLMVEPDTESPELVDALTLGNPTALTVTFSEAVEEESAMNTDHYAVSGGVEVEEARVGTDPETVVLTTSPIAEGEVYTLTVNDVRDRASNPNPIEAGSTIEFLQVHGVITRKVFDGIPGDLVVDLTTADKFPDEPDQVEFVSTLEGPTNFGDNYGQQFEGFLTPPETGEYVFYISSWAYSELFLSTDSDPENKRLIAEEPDATGLADNPVRNWTGEIRRPVVDQATGRRANVSEPIELEAGRKYFIEVLHKAPGGEDNIGVTWQKPGEGVPEEGDPPIPGRYLSAFASVGSVTVTQQPQDQSVEERSAVTFSVEADGTPPYSFQWLRDGEPIEGAVDRTFSLSEASLEDDGATFSVRVENELSGITSEEAALSVTADEQPPQVVSAEGNADWVRIELSEQVDETGATTVGNYHISEGIEVLEADLLENGREVVLTTDPKAAETEYSLTINGITDRAAARNEIAADTQVTFQTFSRLLGDEFESADLDEAKWAVDDRPFEAGSVTHEITQEDGELRLSMTADEDYWGGVALRSQEHFIAAPGHPLTFEIDRVSHEGTGTAQRSAVWITHADREHYVLFAENVGEGGWQYNRQIDEPGDNPTGGGTPMDALDDERFNDQGRHRLRLEADGQTVRFFLDGVLGAEVAFPFQEDLRVAFGGYVRATEDTLDVAFDNAAVTFRLPEAAEPVRLTRQPQDRVVTQNRSASFSVGVESPLPGVGFQWQRDGEEIPGATESTYTTPRLTLDDDGAMFRVVVTPPLARLGEPMVSDEARVTVEPDDEPPRVRHVERTFGLEGRLVVRFDEPVDEASATDPSNYSVDKGVEVIDAEMGEEADTVVLTTSEMEQGLAFNVTVEGVADPFGNRISEAATVSAALPDILFHDDFEEGSLSEEDWRVDNRAFETGAGDFTQTVEDGRLVIDGTATEQWWGGVALAPDRAFPATPRTPLILEVDRIAHEGSGSAHRASVWITHDERSEYINVSENVGEGGWQVNRRIGEPGDNGTGTGTTIEALDTEEFNDQGEHRVRMEADGETVKLYLDDVFGAEVAFPFSEVGFQLGAYARDADDTVRAVFDNVLIGHPARQEEPTTAPRLRATLDVEGQSLTLIWPASAADFVLEATATLSQPEWEPVAASAETSGDEQRVTIPLEGERRFFRLRAE